MGKSPYTKLSLYEYCVLFHPQSVDGEERQTELIVEVSHAMAKDADHASLIAARQIPDGYVDKLDRCEVLTRPF